MNSKVFKHKIKLMLFLGILASTSLLGQIFPMEWSYGTYAEEWAGNKSVIIDETENTIYQIAETFSAGIPTTDGSEITPGGGKGSGYDILVSKYDSDGTLIYRKYIGGSDKDLRPRAIARNGNLYLVGDTGSLDFPTTDGSSKSSSNIDLFQMILDPIGNVQYSSVIPTNGSNQIYSFSLQDDRFILSAYTKASDFPVTNSTTFGGAADIVLVTFDLSFNVLASTYIGGSQVDESAKAFRVGGKYFLFSTTKSNDFPVTDGSTFGTGQDITLTTFDDNLNIIASSYFGGNNTNYLADVEMDENHIYLALRTWATDLPLSIGADNHFGFADDVYYVKMDHSFTPEYSTYIPGSGSQLSTTLAVDNGNATILFTTSASTHPTTGAPFNNTWDPYVIKFDASNSVLFSTYLGGNYSEYNPYLEVFDNRTFISVRTLSTDITTTDGSILKGNTDILFIELNSNGDIERSELIGGLGTDAESTIAVRECEIVLGLSLEQAETFSPTFDSGNTSNPNEQNLALIHYKLDPLFPTENTITPASQSPCLNGLVETILGNAVTSDDGRYNAEFQWQVADAATGPWTDIPNAILKDYLPETNTNDQYYRRLAYDRTSCTHSLISTSNTSLVSGSSLVAAAADAGGVFYVCAGDPVVIGGSPTASGGASPYTYLWDMGAVLNSTTSPNPTATVNESTIITLQVTDANGCISLDQAVINVPIADAGPDRETCEGIGKQIGTPGLPTISGVTYSWDPVTDLDCSTCAQTLATPSAPTTYTLTVEVPLQGGGTCTLTDDVLVTPVTEPVANFAGPDQIICFSDNANLGLPSVADYEYTWAPGNHLYSNNTAQTVFNSGADYPAPNPFTYYLTAQYGECSFVDDVVVTMISEADASEDGCGPRYIGTSDKTPNVNETYSWTVVDPPSHAGAFLGVTNEPIIPVGASPTGVPITYQVEICFGGVCCTDEVIVPDCGGGCDVEIIVDSPVGCPAYDLAPTKLTAVGAIAGISSNNYTYSWTPTEGLSAYNTQTVELTDNVERVYTVVLTSTLDPSLTCSESIPVNGPWSLPTFVPQNHHICPGETVNIGNASVAGYTYEWTGSEGFSSTASNPSVTPTSTSNYQITVVDTGSTCETEAEATVSVVNVVADAGEDRTICSNGIITIGTPDPSGGVWQYSWSPSASPWQNGTDQFSAQPEVLIATNLTFDVTVTDPISGCTATDQIIVTVDDGTPPLVDSPDVQVCEGESVTIGPAEDPSLTYSWSPATGLSCTDCAQPEASPSANTTYTLTVRYGATCSAFASDDVTVTINALPIINLGADLTYCPTGPAVSIGNNAPVGMSSYVWNPSNYLSAANVANPTSSTPSELTYTLEVTDANGCKNSDDIMVTPLQGPDAGINKTICVNSTTTIGNPSNTGSISWTGAAIADLNCTSCPAPEFTPTSAGVFTFIVSSNDGGCIQDDEAVVTVIGVDMPTIATPTPICQGACTQIIFDTNPNYSYVWSPSLGLDDPTIANPTACLSATQKYTLTIFDDATGCYDQTEVTVGVVPVAAPSVTLDNIEVCEGDPAQLNPVVSPAGTYTYSWSPGAGLDNPNIANPSVFTYPVGTKSFELQVTDPTTGCSSLASADVVITPCIILTGKVWIDADGNISLDGSEVQTNAGGLYVYLVDPNTNIILDMAILGADGEYQFDVDVNSQYEIVLSDVMTIIGDIVPSPDLPGTYYNTGENRDGSTETFSLGKITVNTGLMDVVNQDFGIQSIPDSDNYFYDLGNTPGLYNTTAPLLASEGMGPISGNDPEDGAKGFGDTFEITSLAGMNGNVLFYDANGDGIMDPSEILSEGDVITNYNPNKLSVSFSGFGSTNFVFEYASYDIAGAVDPTPATYEVTWQFELPVELIYFEVEGVDCVGHLSWATATEKNNSHFIVEKSNDGKHFDKIGRVEGHGNSAEKIEYEFVDRSLNSETSYYRLKQVDFDGSYVYTEIILLEAERECTQSFSDINIFPNPNNGQFDVSLNLNTNGEDVVQFIITDVLGKTISSIERVLQEGTNTVHFDLESYAPGTYFVTIQGADGNIQTFKILKSNK